MSPKSLVLLLVVGLCAVQMASAHREARGITDILNVAKNKLSGLLGNAEDAARTSMETVKKYVNKIENNVLNAGNSILAKVGIDIDLKDIALLLKDNVKICIKDDEVKADAKVIISSMATCVTKDVKSLNSLMSDMKSLWKTAKDLPSAMHDVSDQCSAHAESDEPIEEDPLQLTDAAESHDLAVPTDELLESASHHLSKRALWDLKRVTRCIKSVYSLAKNDLVAIPAEIMTAATHAYQVVQNSEGDIPKCVSARLVENMETVSRLGVKLGACVASGVSTGERLEAVMSGVKQLTDAAAAVAQTSDAVQTLANIVA